MHTGRSRLGLLVAAGLLAGLCVGCAVSAVPATSAAQPVRQAPTGLSPALAGEAPQPGAEMTAALPGNATIEFVWIRPGTFTMGSAQLEEPEVYNGRPMGFTKEQPAHQVTLSRGFWLGKCEVTQAQWERVMGSNPSLFEGSNRPVEQVSWEDVQEFIGKLNQSDAQAEYRLPTEAEWEYACRAGTTTRWSFGDDGSQLGEYAWWRGNSGESTQDAGKKKPNAWGLYDMHGNVREWCQDWFGSYPSDAQTDPTGPASGSVRVFRGGGWRYDGPLCLRAAFRDAGNPTFWAAYLGFRLVKTAE
jgi:formylglycine-generating enzyme required for sulfatase activity